MEEPIRLINLGKTEWWKTQACYHSIAELMTEDSPDTMILCSTSSPYLCLGYHQKFGDIFDQNRCRTLRIPVIRRSIGGGATYLDSNQLFYQFIFHESRVPKFFNRIFSYFLSVPVNTLNKINAGAELVHPNEIEVGGKRIAGTGGGLLGEAVVLVGNFLFDFDFETMILVWNYPNNDFRTLAIEALKESLITLRQVDGDITQPEVKDIFIREAGSFFERQVIESQLSKEEITFAEKLRDKMIDTDYLNQTDVE